MKKKFDCLLYNEMINSKYQIWDSAFEKWDFQGENKIARQNFSNLVLLI
jgi:hypothetical protein